MLIETKNSTYEIEGDLIRKVAGEYSDRHMIGAEWVKFDHLPWPPKVGQLLCIIIGGFLVRTSRVQAIVVDSKNEED